MSAALPAAMEGQLSAMPREQLEAIVRAACAGQPSGALGHGGRVEPFRRETPLVYISITIHQ